ncbi:hypothetical protein [Cysteiniphilum marinum]|uniref:hypothetical protein n=1 Tax=Cysteiniphilum marinum TaxID=2774191 RepID=UPI00193A247F|nr:hypothetical protein [Cysteiniphilum marinum]
MRLKYKARTTNQLIKNALIEHGDISIDSICSKLEKMRYCNKIDEIKLKDELSIFSESIAAKAKNNKFSSMSPN